MRDSDDFEECINLHKIYQEGRRLFLAGKLDDALEQFKRVYKWDSACHDVASIVHDSYDMPEDEWHKKYRPRFLSEINRA